MGLTSAKPAFRYRAVTRGQFSDQTDWVPFDPTHPLVDGISFGIQHTPWQDEGARVAVTVNRVNAPTAGVATNGEYSVLLVHAHGRPGSQSEVIQLSLGTSDVDGDGLPDDWELVSLGDLGDAATSDRDGDGYTTTQEYFAGTNPADAQSRLALTPPQPGSDSVRWQSVPGKNYSVLRSENVSGPYTVWHTGITATDTTTSVSDPDLALRLKSFFYRIQVDP
jgi:hypothetical protein